MWRRPPSHPRVLTPRLLMWSLSSCTCFFSCPSVLSAWRFRVTGERCLTTLDDSRGCRRLREKQPRGPAFSAAPGSCTCRLGGHPAAAGPLAPGMRPWLPGCVLRAFLGEGGTVTLLESEPHVGEPLEGFLVLPEWTSSRGCWDPRPQGAARSPTLSGPVCSSACAVRAWTCIARHGPPSRCGRGGWEAGATCQDPAGGRQMGSSPQQTGSGSCALSHSASLPVGCGEPCLPGVGALGLGLPTSDLGAPGKARRRTLGQSPGQGRGWRAAGRRLSPRCHDACRPPNMRPKRLGTRFYFGRAFGPHLHVLFFLYSPKCRAWQSTDVSQTEIDPLQGGPAAADILRLSAKPRSLAKHSLGGCLEKMSRRSFFSRPFWLKLWGLNTGSKRSYK